MKTTQQTLNYTEELQNLPKNTEYYKPPIGTSKIEIVGEAVPQEDEDGKRSIQIPVRIGKEDKTWSINKAGEGSLYAQILHVAAKNGNQLKGAVVTLITKATGRTFNGYAVKDYTILEAQEQ